jgi:cytochrome c biogenesis protein CcdA
MTLALVLILLGLALIDSTSFGTLLVPIWLLLTAGRLRTGRILVYLGTVAGFYFAVGMLLVATAGALVDKVAGAFAEVPEPPLRIGQVVVGATLFVWSHRLEARANRSGERPGRIQRWRQRAMSGSGGYAGLVGLALVAALLEVATMLPYLGAIGALVAVDLPWGTTAAVLAGYCLVMCLPALLFAIARLLAHQRIDPLLHRLNSWLTRNSGKMLGWVVGGLGVILVLNGVGNLTIALG